jgi:hypothetical protein
VCLDVTCPKGWGFYDPRLMLSEYYCPRCDVAFLVLEDGFSPGRYVQEFRWKRIGGQLSPCQSDKEGLMRLGERMWDVRLTLLFHHVATFVYQRSRPVPSLVCLNDGSTIGVIGVIPYETDSWISLAWCHCCRIGVGAVSNKLYGWACALTFRYEAGSYRVSPLDGARLDFGLIEDRLNRWIAAGREGAPTAVSPEAGPMEIEDVPVPASLPASLWDGWMTGFKPGALSGKRDWRQ